MFLEYPFTEKPNKWDIKSNVFAVYVISTARAENVGIMRPLLQEHADTATWVVEHGEAEAYRKAGAKIILEGGGLCKSRNLALQDAFSKNLVCVQISDDLRRNSWWTTSPFRKSQGDLQNAVMNTLYKMETQNLYLGGGMPTDSPIYAHAQFKRGNKFATHNFILGDFMVIRPTHLRFNEGMSLKEDYDYTVQHIKEYGGALRNFQVLMNFRHRKNRGGVQDKRTIKTEIEHVKKLQLAHPGWFRPGRRGQTEVVLYAPSATRLRARQTSKLLKVCSCEAQKHENQMIEAVLEHRDLSQGREYRIQWMEPPEVEIWEPLSHLEHVIDYILDYEWELQSDGMCSL